LDRIHRIDDDVSHARLTLHAASELKAQRKKEFKNLHHEAREARRGDEGRSEKLEG